MEENLRRKVFGKDYFDISSPAKPMQERIPLKVHFYMVEPTSPPKKPIIALKIMTEKLKQILHAEKKKFDLLRFLKLK